MDKQELTDILQELARRDISDESNIYDHPCSIAIRALDKCFDDIKFLRGVANGSINSESKRAQLLLGLSYNPTW